MVVYPGAVDVCLAERLHYTFGVCWAGIAALVAIVDSGAAGSVIVPGVLESEQMCGGHSERLIHPSDVCLSDIIFK